MKHYAILCCMLFAVAANLFTTTKAQVAVNDSIALVDLYDSTNVPGWLSKTNWLTTKPVSTWHGITVTGTRVTRIDLYENYLRGSLPSSIGNLTKLTELVLSYNYLRDIPSAIGNLVKLETLYLQGNILSASLPSSIDITTGEIHKIMVSH